MPWLMERVTEQLEKSQLGRMVLDGIMREVVSKRMELYARLEEASNPIVEKPAKTAEEKPSEPEAPIAEQEPVAPATEVCNTLSH